MTGRSTIPGAPGGLAGHVPVLIEEAIAFLEPVAGGSFIDGTFGAGGYTRALLAAGARVLAIDRDPDAIAAGQPLVGDSGGRLSLVQGRFGDLDTIAAAAGFGDADGVVLDVGVSSMQIDTAERGFSFNKDGPLDMRMGPEGATAADVVNEMAEADLAFLLRTLGEERRASFVARGIVRRRVERPFLRTSDLADLIERIMGRRPTDPIHPATRTFQALRIFVNRELDELGNVLAAAERVLRAGGRLVVVTFHSLEDRIVKKFLTERGGGKPAVSRHLPPAAEEPATFRLLTRSPVAPHADEVLRNPRSRSAKLRAAVRTGAPARALDLAAIAVPSLPNFA